MRNWRRVACPLLAVTNLALTGWLIAVYHRPLPVGPAIAAAAPGREAANAADASTTREPRSGASLNWHDAMDQLRRASVPSPIIAAVVRERIAREWTPRETAFERDYLDGKLDAKRLGELHDERAAEEESELRFALGEGYDAWDRQATVDGMYLGGLTASPEQYEPLYRLQKAWLAKAHALEVAKRNGELDDRAFDTQHERAEADYKQQLAAIVGADRVDHTDADPHASQVRHDFARLELSEPQIGQLAAVQEKWSAARADVEHSLERSGTVDAAYYGDLQALDRARDEEVRRILGDERFETWQKSGDDRYLALKNGAVSWSLDAHELEQVYGTIRAYDLAVVTYEHEVQIRTQKGEAVDAGSADQAIAHYTDATARALRQLLGPERFEAMQAQAVFGLRAPHLETRDPSARVSLR